MRLDTCFPMQSAGRRNRLRPAPTVVRSCSPLLRQRQGWIAKHLVGVDHIQVVRVGIGVGRMLGKQIVFGELQRLPDALPLAQIAIEVPHTGRPRLGAAAAQYRLLVDQILPGRAQSDGRAASANSLTFRARGDTVSQAPAAGTRLTCACTPVPARRRVVARSV